MTGWIVSWDVNSLYPYAINPWAWTFRFPRDLNGRIVGAVRRNDDRWSWMDGWES